MNNILPPANAGVPREQKNVISEQQPLLQSLSTDNFNLKTATHIATAECRTKRSYNTISNFDSIQEPQQPRNKGDGSFSLLVLINASAALMCIAAVCLIVSCITQTGVVSESSRIYAIALMIAGTSLFTLTILGSITPEANKIFSWLDSHAGI